MIQANELRIGNYVLGKDEEYIIVDSIYTEDQFGNAGINVETEEYEYNCIRVISFSNIIPIPLTPEILEKCGLEVKTAGDEKAIWYVAQFVKDKRFTINQKKGYWRYSPIYADFDTPIEYLHQLQNLYFALTGEELLVTL